jgi:hypothetical protein
MNDTSGERYSYKQGFYSAIQVMQDLCLAGGLSPAEASNVCMDHYRLALEPWVYDGGAAPVVMMARRLRTVEGAEYDAEELEELPFSEPIEEAV